MLGIETKVFQLIESLSMVFVSHLSITKVIVRWTDVTDIQKKAGLLQETVKVSTR